MLRKNNCLLQQIASEQVRLFYKCLAQALKAPGAIIVPNSIAIFVIFCTFFSIFLRFFTKKCLPASACPPFVWRGGLT